MKITLKYCLFILLVGLIIPEPTLLSAAENSHSRVSHIVICWLKEPNNKEHRQKLIEETKKLQTLPGILSIEVGDMLPSKRAIVDSSFDIGIIMSFRDEKAMNNYLLNPVHQKATKEVLAPLTSKVIVYDLIKVE